MHAVQEYLDEARARIVDDLERGIVKNDGTGLSERLAELRALRGIGDWARAFIEQGKIAERRLREDGQE